MNFKFKSKFLIAFLFSIVVGFNVFSQSVTLNDVVKINLSNLKAIQENGEVKGYSCFYFLDKVNKKENLYGVKIFDVNLKETHFVELQRKKNDFFIQSAYNGSAFCFAFLNLSDDYVEFVVIDKEGNQKGSYKIEKLSRNAKGFYYTANTTENATNNVITGVPGIGFSCFGVDIDKEAKGSKVQITLIDNDAKPLWTSSPREPEIKTFDALYNLYADKNIIADLIISRNGLLSSTFHKYLEFTDVKTGKELFKIIDTDKWQLFPNGVDYNKADDNYYITGEYFNPKDNIAKDKSQGLFFITVGKDGKIVKQSYVSWKDDIGKKVAVNEKGKFLDGMSLAIHTIIKTDDGKIFAIGEQFKRAVSALGVASSILGGMGGSSNSVSVAKVELHDMMVFEFDTDLKIQKVSIYQKDKTSIELPAGFAYIGNSFLATYLKGINAFDYCFTTTSTDNKTFNSVYVNYDKDAASGKAYLIGVMNYNKDKKMVIDKIKLTDKPTAFITFPSKPGYIAICKYYKKAKSLTLSLEKIKS